MIQLNIELVPERVVNFNPAICQITVEEVRENDFDIFINEIEKLPAVAPSLLAGDMIRKRKIILPIADLEAFTGYNRINETKVNEILNRFGRKLKEEVVPN